MFEKVKLSANILFSGIGCQEQGIKYTNLFDLDVKATSDINKDSILSYAILHCGLTKELVEYYNKYPSLQEMQQELFDKNIGYNFKANKVCDWFNKDEFTVKKIWLAVNLSNNFGDISKIKKLPYADLWTVSFPCTSISASGKMDGLNENSGTASSLLWEQIRLLRIAKSKNENPKFILFENVPNLISKLFIHSFQQLIDILTNLGYNCYYNIINAKDCGVPQNRERLYCVCIRKDIDTKKFEFPISFDNHIRVVDILETTYNSNCIKACYSNDTELNKECYNSHKLFPLLISNYNKYSVVKPNEIITLADIKSDNGLCSSTVLKETLHQGNRIFDINGISPTVTASGGGLGGSSGLFLIFDNNLKAYIIRQLNGIECYRLMGINISNDCIRTFNNLGITDNQMSFQAGNGIAANVIKLIFEHLYKALYNNNYKCEDELCAKNRNKRLF
jgi:DNA (cytosine-5)-methyltransferase 1